MMVWHSFIDVIFPGLSPPPSKSFPFNVPWRTVLAGIDITRKGWIPDKRSDTIPVVDLQNKEQQYIGHMWSDSRETFRTPTDHPWVRIDGLESGMEYDVWDGDI